LIRLACEGQDTSWAQLAGRQSKRSRARVETSAPIGRKSRVGIVGKGAGDEGKHGGKQRRPHSSLGSRDAGLRACVPLVSYSAAFILFALVALDRSPAMADRFHVASEPSSAKGCETTQDSRYFTRTQLGHASRKPKAFSAQLGWARGGVRDVARHKVAPNLRKGSHHWIRRSRFAKGGDKT
jgi:hypothetical protein